jgi:hypothetical protein
MGLDAEMPEGLSLCYSPNVTSQFNSELNCDVTSVVGRTLPFRQLVLPNGNCLAFGRKLGAKLGRTLSKMRGNTST